MSWDPELTCMCGTPWGHPDDDWVCARCEMERKAERLAARADELGRRLDGLTDGLRVLRGDIADADLDGSVAPADARVEWLERIDWLLRALHDLPPSPRPSDARIPYLGAVAAVADLLSSYEPSRLLSHRERAELALEPLLSPAGRRALG